MSTQRHRMTVRFSNADDQPAIARFNSRLREGGQVMQLPFDAAFPGEPRPPVPDPPVGRRLVIAEDGEEVRAGMILQSSSLYLRGQARPFCWTQLPLSEGLVDRKHSMAILPVLKWVLSYQPVLMCLGVGSLDYPWSQLMIRSGWQADPVPFFFYPVKVTRVLRRLKYLARRPRLRRGAAVAAGVGAGAGLSGLLAIRRAIRFGVPAFESRVEPAYGDWADEIFATACPEYGAVVRRDSATLNIRQAPADQRYIRLRVLSKRSGKDLGWVMVIHSRMRDDPYFGDLHVGTIVDGFGRLADVPALLAAGLDHLVRLGVDLVVANWSHAAWVAASRRLGMFSFPTNFFFFASPAATAAFKPSCPIEAIHMTRGDCDGPGRLLERPD